MSDRQKEVVAWLSRPETYGPGIESVEHIQTHGAHVFLAGDRAYKLKRAVRFSFMDFSTVEKRRVACRSEVDLNRRTAPSLYLDAMPIVRSGGQLRLGGEGDNGGEAVDWLVVMRRFDQETLFDRLAQRGGLSHALMRDLADIVVDFHRQAEITRKHGGARGIDQVIGGNLATFRGPAAGLIEGAAVDRLEAAWRSALSAHRALLEERRAGGRVRHCHGDLHLRNICLVDGVPTLFDCIEFNDDIACIDVMYDIAFLLMDLQHRGLDDLACRVLGRMLAATGDIGALALLPLFQSLRAGVRAMVAGIEVRGATDSKAATRARADAVEYFGQAERFLLTHPPRLIVVGGLSGTGKSTLAEGLAPGLGNAPGALVLRSDVLRKHLCGVAPESGLGPEAYTADVTAKVYDALIQRAGAALDAGHSVIVDAVFARAEERARVEPVAAPRGARFDGLWLEAPAGLLESRVRARVGDASDATVAVVRDQLRRDVGAVSWRHVDATGDAAHICRIAHTLLT